MDQTSDHPQAVETLLAGGSPGLWTRVFEYLPVGMLLYDAELRVRYANPIAEVWLGAGEMLPDRLGFAADGSHEAMRQTLASLFGNQDRVQLSQIALEGKDGQRRLCHLLGRSVGDGSDSPGPRMAILTLQEISELTTLEQRLATSERLAAVGKLAAKVAHELNNPLDGIMRYIALAQRKIKDQAYDDIPRYLDDVQFGLKRMAEIVRELLEFGRNSTTVSPNSDLIYLMEQTIRTLQPVADCNHVQIVCNYKHMLSVRAGANMYQVLCNVIKNAIDAMPQGGVLTIINDREDGFATIRIQDTGRGIRRQDMPYIFEPFFSTKTNGTGTGLGLAVCKEIMEKMGGSITACNLPEQGCEFVLKVPVRESAERSQ